MAAILKFPAEQVKQHIKSRLAARSQCYVFRADIPAIMFAQIPGQRPCKPGVTLRRIIVTPDPGLTHRVFGYLQEPLLQQPCHFRDMRRVAASEHQHVLLTRQCGAEIVHQTDDAGLSGETLMKF